MQPQLIGKKPLNLQLSASLLGYIFLNFEVHKNIINKMAVRKMVLSN